MDKTKKYNGIKLAGLILLLVACALEWILAYRLSAGGAYGKDGMTGAAMVIFGLLVTAEIIAYLVLTSNRLYEKITLPKVYLICGLVIGIAFTILMPIGVVPDEMAHIRNSYDMSNVLMGQGSGKKSSLSMRREDYETPSIDIEWNHKNSAMYYDNLLAMVKDDEMVVTGLDTGFSPDHVYLVPALGITLGRLCHFGTRLTYLLGRIFCVIGYVLVVYLSLCLLPFGKGLVFVWSFLPMMMQQVNSYSYDRQVISISLLILSLVLNLLYGEEKEIPEGTGKMKRFLMSRKARVILLVAACLFLLPIKQGALVPICLFPMVFFGRWYKEKRKSFSKKTLLLIRISVCAGLCIVLTAALLYLKICMRPERAYAGWVSWANEPGYTIGYLLLHPRRLFALLYNTALSADAYIFGLLGDNLSWHTKSMPSFLLLPFLVMMVIAAFRREDENTVPEKGVKVWIWLMSALVVAFTFGGMLLHWTPLSYKTIEGVQGRYFLPLVVPVLLMCRTKQACIGKHAERVMAMIAVLLQMPIMMYLYMQVV